ncbi:MAG: hypothetical protein SF066_23915 [Thermoanaerobaculia bacterium]|nr:hypothetical protein [Thermoanaerobaculia bacterium]
MGSPFSFLEPRHPLARRVLLMALVAFGLGFGEAGWRAVRASGQVTQSARWIWAADQNVRDQAPQAFYLVRDFSLAAGPVQAPNATLLVAGDEEYVLWLNGQRVGSSRFRGMPLDAFAVGPLLVPGGNRLVAEVRSRRSAGGFLLSLLDAPAGRPLVVTDRTWRVQREARPGLIEGWLPVQPAGTVASEPPLGVAGEEPVEWGSPPTGRWGEPQEPAAGAERVLWRDRLAMELTVPGARAGQGRAGSQRFDFGREVVGYLTLRFASRPPETGPAAALVALALDDPPDLAAGSPTTTIAVVPAGGRVWRDATVRRFRHVEVFGAVAAEASLADPVLEPFAAGAWATQEPAPRGLAGVVPPPTRAPIEDTLRRELAALSTETPPPGT